VETESASDKGPSLLAANKEREKRRSADEPRDDSQGHDAARRKHPDEEVARSDENGSAERRDRDEASVVDAEKRAQGVRDEQANETDVAADGDRSGGQRGNPEHATESHLIDVDSQRCSLLVTAKQKVERSRPKPRGRDPDDDERSR
jgi:hypothetical protein